MLKTTVEIIIPVWLKNDVIKQITAKCKKSLKENTVYPYKLRMLQNNGTGVTRHWNKGIKGSKADIIVICNNDISFFPNWLTFLVVELEKDENTAFISPQMVGNKKQIKQIQRQCGKYGTMPGVIGCCFAFRRKIIDCLGMFDENMKVYYSDHDMWNRVEEAGLKTKLSKGSFITHLGSRTVDSLSNDIKERDHAVYTKKWGEQ